MTKLIGVGVSALLLTGCASMGTADAGLANDKLRPCAAAPHCVSSDASDADHRIAPLAVSGEPNAAWAALKAQLATMPHVAIADEKDGYLHATATSAVMQFVDDFEFALRPAAADGPATDEKNATGTKADGKTEIAMRSSSRIGYYDFNVNRARLESVRAALQTNGVVK